MTLSGRRPNTILDPRLYQPLTPQIVDDATRREFLAAIAALSLLAAACGSDDGDGDAADETRTFVADNGSIEIPVNPKRVVAAIGSFETDMVAVGVMPVLTTTFAGPWVTLDDSVTITANIPPTAEELLKAEPDLIVGWNWVTAEESYDEIVAIAPYVGLGETAESAGPGFDGSEPTRSWTTLFLSVCDAVGKRAEGERLVAEFDDRIAELAARASSFAGQSITRIEFYETGTFSWRGLREDSAELMRLVGLTIEGPEESLSAESLERLPDVSSDWLLVTVGGDMPQEVFDEIAESELYKAIPAVQKGQVIILDGTLWSGFGHLWARAVIDDVERIFFAD